ncbi:hypothetical protein OAP14_09750 [Aliiglaciecola sp.]|nr:hypothetical protein [Aliiglaciecola sp.]
MKDKKFVNEVLDTIPDVRCHEGYFYFQDSEEVLSGFYLERTRHGAYIWKVVYPFYDPASTIHLTYSLRLDGEAGYIDTKSTPKKDLASKLCSIVEPLLEEIQSTRTSRDFKSYIEKNEEFMMNPLVRGVYGTTLLLADMYDDGVNELKICINSLNANQNPEDYAFYSKLLSDAEYRPSVAKDKIQDFIEKKRSALSI